MEADMDARIAEDLRFKKVSSGISGTRRQNQPGTQPGSYAGRPSYHHKTIQEVQEDLTLRQQSTRRPS